MNEYNLETILLCFLLTIVCYMIYPYIMVVIRKRNYSKKECKKMALWNSIVVGIIFMFITYSIDENATWNALPAVTYYWINSWVWVDNNKKNKNSKENLFTCNNCGYDKVKDIDTKCPNCGISFDEKIDNNSNEELFTCNSCGYDKVKDIDTKCPNCGLSFEENENSDNEVFKCDNCGAIVNENATECSNCGEEFEDAKSELSNAKKTNNVEQKYNDLIKLKELLDKKIISKDEFEKEKRKILK